MSGNEGQDAWPSAVHVGSVGEATSSHTCASGLGTVSHPIRGNANHANSVQLVGMFPFFSRLLEKRPMNTTLSILCYPYNAPMSPA